jgi:hypothetical protein
VQLKAVSSISVSDLVLKSLWKVDNLNGLVRTSLDTHTASDAECFRDETNFAGFSDINADLSSFVDGTSLCALEGALLGFALVGVNNCDSQFFSIHVILHTKYISCFD